MRTSVRYERPTLPFSISATEIGNLSESIFHLPEREGDHDPQKYAKCYAPSFTCCEAASDGECCT